MDLLTRGVVGIIVSVLIFSSILSFSAIGLFTGSSQASLAAPSTGMIVTHDPDDISQVFLSPDPMVTTSNSTNASGVDPIIKHSVITDKENALGQHPVLMENSSAHDPSYEELLNFLKNDDTVKNKYVSPNFTCADFAVELQNHAESQGIRCGFAGISFLNSKFGHAMDVFDTTDKGLLYVDTTSGEAHIWKNIHPGAQYDNMGIISDVTNYW